MNPVICTWNINLAKGHLGVWPDGCRDVIAIFPKGETPKVICSGLDAAPRLVVCDGDTQYFGIRFAPWVAFPWDKAEVGSKCIDVNVSQYFPTVGQSLDFFAEGESVFAELFCYEDLWSFPAPQWLMEYFEALRAGMPERCSSLSERSVRRKMVQMTGAAPRYWQGLVRARKAGLEICESDIPQRHLPLITVFPIRRI
ncbi:hypothetical protein [Desulfurispirillum indicum]|uniref:hypothetical protein n=1 Tax=Desulfurispirillum indicum TaxID=936456 RepID=UPI0001C46093|nr:hypothetical protein [Desulfurispirillum indicum]